MLSNRTQQPLGFIIITRVALRSPRKVCNVYYTVSRDARTAVKIQRLKFNKSRLNQAENFSRYGPLKLRAYIKSDIN